jgi:IS5 family transposase
MLVVPDSDLSMFLDEVHRLAMAAPALLSAIDNDLDAHGRRKKALRLADAHWERSRGGTLPTLDAELPTLDPDKLVLADGRPRTPAYVVLFALLLRGYLGEGFKACDATTFLYESISLHVFFRNLGMKLPGRSTLTELINAVTNDTRRKILDAQIAVVLGLRWDDFGVMIQDSTHVEGNTAWPTDSRTMVALAHRILRVGAAMPKLGLPALATCRALRRNVSAMVSLDREIDFAKGTKEADKVRRGRYEKLLLRARRALRRFEAGLGPVACALEALDVRPSDRAKADRAVARLRDDIAALAKVISHCEARVLHDRKVPIGEKVLSLSDPEAGFIAKGQRDPVIGYKPQLARSGAGYVTGLLLPPGNASDSGQLVPMTEAVIKSTGVTPRMVSVDDGYASAANVKSLRDKGIEIVSISGSKGRRLTNRKDWYSDEYTEARDLRSAAESLMFTLKNGYAFDAVARRGLVAVEGEMLEKALAYNACRMALTRRAREENGGEESLMMAA